MSDNSRGHICVSYAVPASIELTNVQNFEPIGSDQFCRAVREAIHREPV